MDQSASFAMLASWIVCHVENFDSRSSQEMAVPPARVRLGYPYVLAAKPASVSVKVGSLLRSRPPRGGRTELESPKLSTADSTPMTGGGAIKCRSVLGISL